MRNRFVRVVRALGPAENPGTHYCYKPVELRNGNLYALCSEAERGSDGFPMGVQGFFVEADAWKVIDRIEARDKEREKHQPRVDESTEPPAWKDAEARGENPFRGLR